VQEPREGESSQEVDPVRSLQSQVEGVKDIMTQNVDRILARGERLDDLMGKSEDLQAGVSLQVQKRCFLSHITALSLAHCFYYAQNNPNVWLQKDYLMFFKEVPCAHQGCIYLIENKYSKNSTIVKYYYNLK